MERSANFHLPGFRARDRMCGCERADLRRAMFVEITANDVVGVEVDHGRSSRSCEIVPVLSVPPLPNPAMIASNSGNSTRFARLPEPCPCAGEATGVMVMIGVPR